MMTIVQRGAESIALEAPELRRFALPTPWSVHGCRVAFRCQGFHVWDALLSADDTSPRIVFDNLRAHLRLIPESGKTVRVRAIAPVGESPNFSALLRAAGLTGQVPLLKAEPEPADIYIDWFPYRFDEGALELAQCKILEQCAEGAESGNQLVALFEEKREKLLRAHLHQLRNTADWFSNPLRYAKLPFTQFVYSLLTADQRTGHAEIKALAPGLTVTVEQTITRSPATPPMFSPFKLRDLYLPNRVVVSPMCMYSADNGAPNDFHLVHLGARALGGAGLVMTEMTNVSDVGRISPGCAGLYCDAQVAPWKRIVDFVHAATPARIGVQLGHAGPKASTQRGWEKADAPLPEGNWPIVAASPVPYAPYNQIPAGMNESTIDLVTLEFRAAAARAAQCGFDLIELHFAHGYLLSSFLSPLTNRRADCYGGSLENRLRFPLHVFDEVRRVWPEHRPITVRISASDWAEGGLSADDAVEIARHFRSHGADAISVSTGQTTPEARPLYGRMYQVPFSDRIRQEADIPTIAVGAITSADEINAIIAAGRADLCALARPHLVDPAWTLRASIEQGHTAQIWPKQYLAGKAQAERQHLKGAA